MTDTLYHVKHSCGHTVYWSSPVLGVITSIYPCPWCGGEAKIKSKIPPPGVIAKQYWRGEMVTCRQTAEGYDPLTENMNIIIQHMANNVCCKE